MATAGPARDHAGMAPDPIPLARVTRGRWTLENTYDDHFLVPIEAKGEPSRWLTLEALRVLSAA
ncbi:hypothetical protein BH11ACT1_BH11ACT1_22410 [soil metagenome]